MKDDTECPYCGADIEICHDDGAGYAEDEIHQQTCHACDKTFTYTTSISFYYETEKAPCLNGEPHKWKKVIGFPEEYLKDKYRCEWCDEEYTIPIVESPTAPRGGKQNEVHLIKWEDLLMTFFIGFVLGVFATKFILTL